MHEYARHARALSRLHEHEHLRKFIERPEAARQEHVGARPPDEHRLARKEVPEQQGDVLVCVAELLARQLDVETHRGGATEVGAAIGSLHDSRAAARNHGESGVRKQPGRLLGKRVIRMAGRNARAAEHAHRGTDLVHSLGGLDEF